MPENEVGLSHSRIYDGPSRGIVYGPRSGERYVRWLAGFNALTTKGLLKRVCPNKRECSVEVCGDALMPPGILKSSSLIEVVSCIGSSTGTACPEIKEVIEVQCFPNLIDRRLPRI